MMSPSEPPRSSDAVGSPHPAPPTAPLPELSPVPLEAFNPAELLSRLWQQNLPLMRERVACLERAAQEAATGPLAPVARTEAADLAHKLAGSLGMFGYPKGTDISREIEAMLEAEGVPDGMRLVKLTADLRSVLGL